MRKKRSSSPDLREMNVYEKQHHSLAAKTVRSTVLGCMLLGAVALLIGLGFYSFTLGDQYIRHAFNVASHASMSISHGADSRGLADEVMRIYRSLSEEERQAVGTEAYRAHFASVDVSKGSEHDVMTNMLMTFLDTGEIDDVYLAMYDRDTCALVYIVDPDQNIPMEPGDWESVPEKEVKAFLDWDGTGMLYDISHMDKYGFLCTAGVPIRSREDDSICLFVLADVSLDKVISGMKGYALQVLVGVLVASMLVSWLLTRRMRKKIVEPINAIAGAAASYARDRHDGTPVGDHFSGLGIQTRDEIENLSRTMANMERELTEHEAYITRITAEKERLGAELSLAKRIQASMMPHIFPPFPDRHEFDIYATMDPAKEVGGDFYDFFLIDEDHLCLVMADVSGKGVPAALFMMASKIILQSCAMLGQSVSEILTKTNEAICSNNQADMFITVWIGVLEISTGKMTCANAGHEYPVLKRAGGRFEMVHDRHGFVIGGLEGIRYSDYTLQLNPGDQLFLYTDGVPEAANREMELFGMDRMLAALNQAGEQNPTGLLKAVRASVDGFVKDAEQFDDLTMMCLEYKG